MRNALHSAQSHRRSPVFRLRALPIRPPVGQRAFVAHGHAGLSQLAVRSGDVLCVATHPAGAGLEVFEPRSPGHPMLGRRSGADLRSLPADLPCSSSLWVPVGAVAALWRRGFASQPAPSVSLPASTPAAVAPLRRAVCVHLSQPALALARADHPHLMGAQLEAAPQPGGSVLVFPGGGDAQPVAQASARDLRALADQLAQLLGPGARVVQATPAGITVTAWRQLTLPMATVLARSMARQLRLPISVVVADSLPQAQGLVGTLGGEQLLWLLPPVASARVAAPAAVPAALPHPAPAPPALVPAPAPPQLPRPRVSAWPTPHPSRVAADPQPGALQLSLFDHAHAA
jgi:hypothetical protein